MQWLAALLGGERSNHLVTQTPQPDDPRHSYEMDRLADDLMQIELLDLHEITLVGQSMGCAEIARYLSRHGNCCITCVALISPSE